jgi:hypothetical protein
MVMAALGSGCVYYHRWDRPGATEQEFYRDSDVCHHQNPRGWCWGDGCQTVASVNRDAVERCLRARGWRDRGKVSWSGGSDEEYAGPSN